MKTAYTDYPFLSLGDEEFSLAPIREIKIISYDGDKYVKILVEGLYGEIKSSYVYRNKKRFNETTKMRFPRSCASDYFD